ncbi:MAG: ABC transporter permease [Sphaerobacter sp.]|nr:ABC transporter permease [Sphaerobacter sp.]
MRSDTRVPPPDARSTSLAATSAAAAGRSAVPERQVTLAWRRFKRDRLALAGGIFVLVLVLVALLAPVLAPYDPAEQFTDGLTADGLPVPSTLPGSTRFLLGTDQNGRDLLSRIIWGARVSLTVGVLANVIAVGFSVMVGAVAGYLGGWRGNVIMRFTDMMMAFPTLLLAIALVAILRPSIWVIIVVIGAVYWTWIARIIYGAVRSLRELEFVTAAVSIGAPTWRIILRHILPHLLSIVIVWASLGISTNVMLEASLSYLGIGVQPPTPSWGGMIQQGQSFYRAAPWLVIYPGLAIMLTILCFNLLGDGLRDALDPQQQRR